MPAHSPEHSLGFLIKDVARLMLRNFNARARHIGLTQAQWQTLAHLSRREGINQVMLADLMDIQPITLARQIDRLEAAGYVERRPDPKDRRAVRLFLKPAAEPLIGTMWDLAAQTRAEALAGLPGATRDLMIEALQHMRNNLMSREGEPSLSADAGERALTEVTDEPESN